MTFKTDEAGRPAVKGRPRPLRERRRVRRQEDPRHEALESVNQLLVRYEQTIDKLGQAEENYRAIFEDAPVGMFRVSRSGRPLKLNRRMAQICGYEAPDQFLARVSNVARQLLVEPH
jgi:PAS domain-containing protein